MEDSTLQMRFLVSFLAFLSMVILYALRVNLSIAIVAMVKKTADEEKEDSNVCPDLAKKNNASGTSTKQGEFDWDAEMQGHMMSAFFYGDLITPIPAGILAAKYGALWVLGGGVLITGIFTLLTPLCARWDPWALFAMRFLVGMGAGVGYPSVHTMVGKWIPMNERSLQLTLIYDGVPMGNILALIFSGILIKSEFLGGWPSVFYIMGLLTCTWFLFWTFLVYESPHDHPFVLTNELKTIMGGVKAKPKRGPIPWKAISKSLPVYALCLTHFCNNWGYYTMLIYVPTYLHQVLHYDIKQNGLMASLPYMMAVLFSLPVSILVDKVRTSGRLKVTTLRKLSNSVAFYVPGLCLILLPFLGCDETAIIALLSLTTGFNGFKLSGFEVTHIDMTPEFGGLLMSGSNTAANFAGIVTPIYAGQIQKAFNTIDSWMVIFCTAGMVYLIGGTVFNVLCTAELQEWGTTKQTPDEEKSNSDASTDEDSREDPEETEDRKNSEEKESAQTS